MKQIWLNPWEKYYESTKFMENYKSTSSEENNWIKFY